MIWIFIGLAVALALLSLRGDGEKERYVREKRIPQEQAWPPATVIVPVKGGDEGLEQNLAALAALDYPDFELLVTVREQADLPVRLPEGARLVTAGAPAEGTGEKIHNLLAAVRAARPESAILAFADSDGQAQPLWLKGLAAALAEPGVGASTGYRWHAPAQGGAASVLRSVWNSVIAGGFGPRANRFLWGGAMAIRRADFERLRVPAYWQGAVSDDYRMAEAVLDAGLRIAFAPAATVASRDHTTFAGLREWITRQMRITRFYANGLWRQALIAHIIYCVAMAGAAWLAWRGSGWAALALAIQLGAGMWKGARRARLARMVLTEDESWFRRWGWTHWALVPVGTWLWLYACATAGLSDVIVWRGRRHVLRPLGKPGADIVQ